MSVRRVFESSPYLFVVDGTAGFAGPTANSGCPRNDEKCLGVTTVGPKLMTLTWLLELALLFLFLHGWAMGTLEADARVVTAS